MSEQVPSSFGHVPGWIARFTESKIALPDILEQNPNVAGDIDRAMSEIMRRAGVRDYVRITSVKRTDQGFSVTRYGLRPPRSQEKIYDAADTVELKNQDYLPDWGKWKSSYRQQEVSNLSAAANLGSGKLLCLRRVNESPTSDGAIPATFWGIYPLVLPSSMRGVSVKILEGITLKNLAYAFWNKLPADLAPGNKPMMPGVSIKLNKKQHSGLERDLENPDVYFGFGNEKIAARNLIAYFKELTDSATLNWQIKTVQTKDGKRLVSFIVQPATQKQQSDASNELKITVPDNVVDSRFARELLFRLMTEQLPGPDQLNDREKIFEESKWDQYRYPLTTKALIEGFYRDSLKQDKGDAKEIRLVNNPIAYEFAKLGYALVITKEQDAKYYFSIVPNKPVKGDIMSQIVSSQSNFSQEASAQLLAALLKGQSMPESAQQRLENAPVAVIHAKDDKLKPITGEIDLGSSEAALLESIDLFFATLQNKAAYVVPTVDSGGRLHMRINTMDRTKYIDLRNIDQLSAASLIAIIDKIGPFLPSVSYEHDSSNEHNGDTGKQHTFRVNYIDRLLTSMVANDNVDKSAVFKLMQHLYSEDEFLENRISFWRDRINSLTPAHINGSLELKLLLSLQRPDEAEATYSPDLLSQLSGLQQQLREQIVQIDMENMQDEDNNPYADWPIHFKNFAGNANRIVFKTITYQPQEDGTARIGGDGNVFVFDGYDFDNSDTHVLNLGEEVFGLRGSNEDSLGKAHPIIIDGSEQRQGLLFKTQIFDEIVQAIKDMDLGDDKIQLLEIRDDGVAVLHIPRKQVSTSRAPDGSELETWKFMTIELEKVTPEEKEALFKLEAKIIERLGDLGDRIIRSGIGEEEGFIRDAAAIGRNEDNSRRSIPGAGEAESVVSVEMPEGVDPEKGEQLLIKANAVITRIKRAYERLRLPFSREAQINIVKGVVAFEFLARPQAQEELGKLLTELTPKLENLAAVKQATNNLAGVISGVRYDLGIRLNTLLGDADHYREGLNEARQKVLELSESVYSILLETVGREVIGLAKLLKIQEDNELEATPENLEAVEKLEETSGATDVAKNLADLARLLSESSTFFFWTSHLPELVNDAYDNFERNQNVAGFDEAIGLVSRLNDSKLEELFDSINNYYQQIRNSLIADIRSSVMKKLGYVFGTRNEDEKRVAWNSQVIEALNEAETLQLIEILTRIQQDPEQALQSLDKRDFILLARLIDGHVGEIMSDIMA